MENLEVLKKIMLSDCEYWVVERTTYGSDSRSYSDIILVAIPLEFAEPVPYDQITLKSMERLQSCELSNIHLTSNYAPFQLGITLYSVTQVAPVKTADWKSLLVRLLELGKETRDFWDFEKAIEEFNKIEPTK